MKFNRKSPPSQIHTHRYTHTNTLIQTQRIFSWTTVDIIRYYYKNDKIIEVNAFIWLAISISNMYVVDSHSYIF